MNTTSRTNHMEFNKTKKLLKKIIKNIKIKIKNNTYCLKVNREFSMCNEDDLEEQHYEDKRFTPVFTICNKDELEEHHHEDKRFTPVFTICNEDELEEFNLESDSEDYSF